MRDLNYQLKQLCRHCREGSFDTQAKREWMLTQMADQLHELGYRHMTASSLKPKHIEALLDDAHADVREVAGESLAVLNEAR